MQVMRSTKAHLFLPSANTEIDDAVHRGASGQTSARQRGRCVRHRLSAQGRTPLGSIV